MGNESRNGTEIWDNWFNFKGAHKSCQTDKTRCHKIVLHFCGTVGGACSILERKQMVACCQPTDLRNGACLLGSKGYPSKKATYGVLCSSLLAQAHFHVCQLNYTTVHKCTVLLQYCKNGACSGTLKQQNDFSRPHHVKLIDQQALICILTQ